MWEKNLAKIRSKTTKNLLCSLAKLERERKDWKSFEKVVWISQNTIFKKLDSRCSIDRKTGSINQTRQRLTEIFKQDFDWLKIRLDQSKFWKNSFLEKKPDFLKAYLKALNIRYKNAWVWDENFFKNTWIQPKSSKIKIFNKFVLEAQTLNTFCIKIKELLILDGHNKITHNIMYQV